jgi:hypothetical protein
MCTVYKHLSTTLSLASNSVRKHKFNTLNVVMNAHLYMESGLCATNDISESRLPIINDTTRHDSALSMILL